MKNQIVKNLINLPISQRLFGGSFPYSHLCILISIFLFSSLISIPPAQASTINKPTNFLTLNTGLVGWWTFDGADMRNNVADRSGNGNHGYLTGQTSTSTVMGKIGQALYFDGVDDAVAVTSINGSSWTTLSYSFWAKMVEPGHTGVVIGWGMPSLVYCIVGGRSNNMMCTADGNTAGGVDSTTDIYANPVWNHFVYVVNGNNQKLYTNGVLEDSATETFSATTSSAFYYGKYSGAGNSILGTLDDVRIYNRALSTSTIQQLYNLGAGTKQNTTPRGISATGFEAGLVGHWTFDGPNMKNNVTDSSGLGSNGFLMNQTSTTTVMGKVGQALSFDGVDDYVKLADANQANVAGDITTAFWLKMNTSSNNAVPIHKDIQYTFLIASSGYVSWADSSNWSYGAFGSQDIGFTMNEWQHIAITKTGGVVKIFRNGVGRYSALFGGSITTTSNPMAIGCYYSGSSCFSNYIFPGLIDDVRVYNRALSTSTIQQLYNMGAGAKQNITPKGIPTAGLESGLVGHWTFDGPKMRNNVADSSTYGNNGYLSSGFTATTTAIGKLGQALNFDGTDDHVSMTRFTSAIGLTLGAWVKTTSTDSSAGYVGDAAQNVIGDNTGGIFLGFGVHGGKVQYNHYNTAWHSVTGNISVNDGKWHYILATHNQSSGVVNIYVDGNFDVTDTVAYTLAVGINRLGGGYNGAGTGDLFTGTLDDVRVYSRALSASEIQQLYNMGR